MQTIGMWDWEGLVWQAPLRGGNKTTLLALKRFMQPDDMSCYPSLRKLSDMTGAHRETVRRHLKKGVDIGLLVIENRHAKHGGLTSNLYRAAKLDFSPSWEALPPPRKKRGTPQNAATPLPAKTGVPSPQNMGDPPRKNRGGTTLNKPIKQTNRTKRAIEIEDREAEDAKRKTQSPAKPKRAQASAPSSTVNLKATSPVVEDFSFDAWWTLYPKKEGKSDALKLFNALGADSRQKLFPRLRRQIAIWELTEQPKNYQTKASVFIKQRGDEDLSCEDRLPDGTVVGEDGVIQTNVNGLGKRSSEPSDLRRAAKDRWLPFLHWYAGKPFKGERLSWSDVARKLPKSKDDLLQKGVIQKDGRSFKPSRTVIGSDELRLWAQLDLYLDGPTKNIAKKIHTAIKARCKQA